MTRANFQIFFFEEFKSLAKPGISKPTNTLLMGKYDLSLMTHLVAKLNMFYLQYKIKVILHNEVAYDGNTDLLSTCP